MPIYEYECVKCRYRFERILPKGEGVYLCPNCGNRVKKLPSAFGFVFGDQVRHPNHPDNVQASNEKRRKVKKVLGLIFALTLMGAPSVFPQVQITTTVPPTVKEEHPYIYHGWKHKTTLRSNTWDGTKGRPPQPNDRLYEYKNGVKTGTYYEWNGYDWVGK